MATVLCSNELDVSSLEPLPQPAMTQPKKQSYGQILKSSALVGGSSVLNVGIGIVRTKVMAMLLGPAGFGLFGLYGSVADLSLTLAGLGVNSSGVRQIAQAVGTADVEEIALTTVVLRRASIVLGVLGAILLCVFSRQVSNTTFGTAAHQGAICLLSLAVFFRLVSAGQGALIQGMRRIRDLAKMQVLGALSGTLISIALVYKFRDNGVVPALVGVAAMTIVTSWWYSRKIEIKSPRLTLSQTKKEVSDLLKLGLAFMSSGLMTMGVAYGTRITILHKLGIQATGLYQSAWILGGLYVSFVLQAMAADFYPRLTASAKNNDECNRLVNEQALVGLLLAGPGVIATLTFAPLVIALFYSAKFGAAVVILRWICLGAMLQVITWPMGFIIVAKGKPGLYFSLRIRLDRCCARFSLGLRKVLRFERCRHRIFWLVCLSLLSDLSNCTSPERFSLVYEQSMDDPIFCFPHRGSFLCTLRVKTYSGLRCRNPGSDPKLYLFNSNSSETRAFGSPAASRTAVTDDIGCATYDI